MTPDPTAAKVLSHGEALPAPAGRADDFSWPHRDSNVSTPSEALPQPVTAAPSTLEKNDTAAKDDTKKSTDAEKHPKAKSASDSGVSKAWRAPNEDLDGLRTLAMVLLPFAIVSLLAQYLTALIPSGAPSPAGPKAASAGDNVERTPLAMLLTLRRSSEKAAA
jgi:hypothetical protein